MPLVELLAELAVPALRTLQLTALSAAGAAGLALAAAAGKLSPRRALRWAAIGYIELFRGTSAVVQLFWIFFVLPHFGIVLDAMTAAVLGLSLCVGAYGAEIVVAAVRAVPAGQLAAADALGLRPWDRMRHVVFPQALRRIIAPASNLTVELLKLTSVTSLVTVAELSFSAQSINQTTMRTAEVFGVTMLLYFAMSSAIIHGFRLLERRAARYA